MKPKLGHRVCSVAKTVEIMGERWSFLIIREAFFRVRNYDQFQNNLGIATNILSDRLKVLVQNGIFKKEKNPEDGRRFIYKLSEKGLDLYPIILAIMNWGDRWLCGEEGPPLELFHRTCGHKLTPVMCCSHCGDIIDPREISFTEKFPLQTGTDQSKGK